MQGGGQLTDGAAALGDAVDDADHPLDRLPIVIAIAQAAEFAFQVFVGAGIGWRAMRFPHQCFEALARVRRDIEPGAELLGEHCLDLGIDVQFDA